jgi:hypothetical protein
MLAKNSFYINPRHYDFCYHKKHIIQACTGPYKHFKNMKIAFYNRNGQNILAKNIFYISPDTMIHVVMKNISFRPLQAHAGPCRPVTDPSRTEIAISQPCAVRLG